MPSHTAVIISMAVREAEAGIRYPVTDADGPVEGEITASSARSPGPTRISSVPS